MWLLLVGLLDAHADPFNAWPGRTPKATIALNPYVGIGPAFASAYLFWGAADRLDVIAGYAVGIDEGAAYAGPADLYLRAFPFDTAEIALVLHGQYGSPDDWFVGPELHATTRPTRWLGLWLDVGWRGRERVDPGYLWAGFEITASRPFIAFEADFELAMDGTVTTTFVPSIGVWLGSELQNGLSVGAFMEPTSAVPTGVGAWYWHSIDLSRGRRVPPEPGQYHVDEGCEEQ